MGAAALVCCFCCTFFLSMVLQTVGFFTPSWITWDGCEAQGLFYYVTSNATNATNECRGSGDYISQSALGLQATSLVINLMISISVIGTLCCNNDDDDDDVGICGCCVACFILLYPVAGLFSFVGCIMMGKVDIPEYTYSYSFYLCLASGIYVIIQVILVCYGVYKVIKDGDDGDYAGSAPSVRSAPTTVATTTASGQLGTGYRYGNQDVAVAVAEREEVHVSNGMMFMRKIQIMKIVGIVR